MLDWLCETGVPRWQVIVAAACAGLGVWVVLRMRYTASILKLIERWEAADQRINDAKADQAKSREHRRMLRALDKAVDGDCRSTLTQEEINALVLGPSGVVHEPGCKDPFGGTWHGRCKGCMESERNGVWIGVVGEDRL